MQTFKLVELLIYQGFQGSVVNKLTENNSVLGTEACFCNYQSDA